MDPGTILAVAEITAKVLQQLVEVGRELKDAPTNLALLTAEVKTLNLQFKRFSVIQRDLPLEGQRFLDAQVNTRECQDLLAELADLVLKIQPGQKMELSGRFKWMWNKKTVEGLVRRLEQETERLARLLTPEQLYQLLGVTSQVLETSSQTHELVEHLVSLVEQLRLPPPPAYSPIEAQHSFPRHPEVMEITWHGQWRCKPGQDFKHPYFHDRFQLAQANYFGNWKGVKKMLEKAEDVYGQNWVNATRIYDTHDTEAISSGYTALHQAAWHGDKAIAEYLIRKGAWKLSRTFLRGSTQDKYRTPLDIAASYGWAHMYEPLAPVIRRPISFKILAILQSRLHDLIHGIFAGFPDVHLDYFHLPELEVLTEFEHAALIFPLNPDWPDPQEGRTVRIVLDGNELVVVMSFGKEDRKNYRLSEDGVEEIQQAVVMN